MSYGLVLGSVFVVHVLAMLSPGPNVLVVTQTAASRTRRAGVLVALGIATGAALWSGAALLGLAVLFEQVAGLYGVLTLLGGAYLLTIAFQDVARRRPPAGALRGRARAGADRPASLPAGPADQPDQSEGAGLLRQYLRGAADARSADLGQGCGVRDHVANSTLWHVALACFFSTERTQRFYRRVKLWIDRVAAIALALLGLRLMLPAWRALAG